MRTLSGSRAGPALHRLARDGSVEEAEGSRGGSVAVLAGGQGVSHPLRLSPIPEEPRPTLVHSLLCILRQAFGTDACSARRRNRIAAVQTRDIRSLHLAKRIAQQQAKRRYHD